MNEFLRYLFSPLPGTKFGFYKESIALIALLVMAALFLKIFIRKAKNSAFKKHFGNASGTLLLFALFFGIIFTSRYEKIAFFGMRFMMYLTIAIFLYWLGRQIYIFFTKYRKDSAQIEQMSSMPKYSTKKH